MERTLIKKVMNIIHFRIFGAPLGRAPSLLKSWIRPWAGTFASLGNSSYYICHSAQSISKVQSLSYKMSFCSASARGVVHVITNPTPSIACGDRVYRYTSDVS